MAWRDCINTKHAFPSLSMSTQIKKNAKCKHVYVYVLPRLLHLRFSVIWLRKWSMALHRLRNFPYVFLVWINQIRFYKIDAKAYTYVFIPVRGISFSVEDVCWRCTKSFQFQFDCFTCNEFIDARVCVCVCVCLAWWKRNEYNDARLLFNLFDCLQHCTGRYGILVVLSG